MNRGKGKRTSSGGKDIRGRVLVNMCELRQTVFGGNRGSGISCTQERGEEAVLGFHTRCEYEGKEEKTRGTEGTETKWGGLPPPPYQ